MEFLKQLIHIQHETTLQQVSKLVFPEGTFEQEQFIQKYNKRNYCLVRVRNTNMRYNLDRVKVDDLLSSLKCVHNPSSSRSIVES